jgi:hyperosmotically inducible protein
MAVALGLAACSQTRTQKTAGETIDDGVTTAKVKAALINDPVTKARQIDVEVYRGVVELGGFVATEEEKERATEVARSVNGVKDVKNNLQVRQQVAERTAGDVVDDNVITARVKAALVQEPATKARQINVETRQGVVLLSGFVDSEEEKERAEEVARTVSGVKSVENGLEIKQEP